MTFLQTLGNLAVVSVIVSALVQWLKQHFGGSNKALLILAALSIVGGLIYFFVKQLSVWPLIVADITVVFSIANAIYVVIIQWFEAPTITTTSTLVNPNSTQQQ